LLSAKLPNTTIGIAESIPAGTYQPPGSAAAFTDLPAFCRVTATLSPVPDSSIGIEVWLPTTTWNGRYQQVGNHGWGGTIYWSEMAPQLRRGFATGATDDGHVRLSSNPFDVSWAFGHPSKIDDFAWRAVHELAEKAKLLITAYYGKHQSYTYFNGCSDGGREGLREAHDFPDDFDGVLFGGAASYWTHAATEQLFMSINLKNSGIQGTSGAVILTLAQNAATKACDAADGVVDGLIRDPQRCHWDPHTLICKAGQDQATCITPAQANAIEANVRPVRDPVTGKWVFSGMSRGSEFDQIRFGYNLSLAPFGVSNYQLALNDPTWDGSTFDLHADLPTLDRMLGVMNLTDTDLHPFRETGGKMIQWHGWDDAAFTPGWTIKYYEEVVKGVGRGNLQRVQDFYRLFMLPGVGHCGTGIGPDDIGAENQTAVSSDPEHDAVSALLDWVEHGVAPQKLIATKFNNNDPTQGIQIQRPICPYPSQAIYNGAGDTSVASSFHCGVIGSSSDNDDDYDGRYRGP
jgi:feruloyl esterase